MRVKQGYISDTISSFDFLHHIGVGPYISQTEPVVVYGCYTPKDLKFIKSHKSKVVLRWCGADILRFGSPKYFKDIDIIHTTALRIGYDKLIQNGINVIKTLPEGRREDRLTGIDMNKINPTPLGAKIYLYNHSPKIKPTKHIRILMEELKKKKIPYSFVYSDKFYSMNEWYSGVCDQFYNESFIGLMLSEFAKGCTSVIDLGLRGRKCVSNIIDLPNVINWKNADDICESILNEVINIGKPNKELAEQVYNSLDRKYEWLNI
jgi:hypothetical protein